MFGSRDSEVESTSPEKAMVPSAEPLRTDLVPSPAPPKAASEAGAADRTASPEAAPDTCTPACAPPCFSAADCTLAPIEMSPVAELPLIPSAVPENCTPPCACPEDRKSTRLNSSHVKISYAVFC